MKPVLKWVGGKRQLIKEIEKYMPIKYNNYHEPFVGGGALLFHLECKNSYINDCNSELINLYNVIKNESTELIEDLKKHKNESEYFYDIRSLDRNHEEYSKLSNVKKASRIVYLNKTAYNGLYRVNLRGELNAPFGKYKNPLICDEDNIRSVSNYFNQNNIIITNEDFEKCLDNVKKRDFVYLDPPYQPISSSSSFTGYQPGGFTEDDQKRVKDMCDKINDKGAYFMLSNSYCDFIKELYSEYEINIVYAKRNINSNGKLRGEIKEVLITNY